MWQLEKWSNETWAWVDDVFTKEELDAIVKTYSGKDTEKGLVANNEIKDIRKSDVVWVSPDKDAEHIYQKITGAVGYLNQFFMYDLSFIETMQFTTYHVGQYYGEHKDVGFDMGYSRKLSLVLQLTDEGEYEGGELYLYGQSYKAPDIMSRKRGRLVAFPSWVAHEVKPVTKGTRHSLVAWVNGPRFK